MFTIDTDSNVLYLTRGDTGFLSINIDQNLELTDTIEMTVKKGYDDAEFLIKKIITGIEGSVIDIIIDATDTADPNTFPYGKYVYDLVFKRGDIVRTFVVSNLIITSEVNF